MNVCVYVVHTVCAWHRPVFACQVAPPSGLVSVPCACWLFPLRFLHIAAELQGLWAWRWAPWQVFGVSVAYCWYVVCLLLPSAGPVNQGAPPMLRAWCRLAVCVHGMWCPAPVCACIRVSGDYLRGRVGGGLCGINHPPGPLPQQQMPRSVASVASMAMGGSCVVRLPRSCYVRRKVPSWCAVWV